MKPHQAGRRACAQHVIEARRTADEAEVFAEGWLDNDTSVYRGRPVDVVAIKDGSLLVADYAGALCRMSDGAP